MCLRKSTRRRIPKFRWTNTINIDRRDTSTIIIITTQNMKTKRFSYLDLRIQCILYTLYTVTTNFLPSTIKTPKKLGASIMKHHYLSQEIQNIIMSTMRRIWLAIEMSRHLYLVLQKECDNFLMTMAANLKVSHLKLVMFKRMQVKCLWWVCIATGTLR